MGALTRLDENRARYQMAMKAGVFYASVTNTTIWGNHSTTQVPDFVNARIKTQSAEEVINDTQWFEEEFTPLVATRGGALIKKWAAPPRPPPRCPSWTTSGPSRPPRTRATGSPWASAPTATRTACPRT